MIMKKYSFLLLSLGICSGALCQAIVDLEKEAIIAVINAETQSYCDRDWEAFAATYKHDESNVDIRAYRTNYAYTVGWAETAESMKEFFRNNPEPIKNLEVKKNFRIKVHNDFAWAVFDQDVQNDEGEVTATEIGSNILEKVNGEWKIVYLSRLGTSSYYGNLVAIQVPEEDLTKYTGKYEIEPGFILSIFKEGDHLYSTATGQDTFEIFAYEPHKYFVKAFYGQIEFNMENEQAVSLTLFQGGETEAKKIE